MPSAMIQKHSFKRRLKKDIARNKVKYILIAPLLVYFILFCYRPMYGLIIAFKDYVPAVGFSDSQWIGLKSFERFLGDYFIGRLLRNTFLLSLYSILWGFPAPIILALMLNELRAERFKRVVQSIVYIPHFISMVVVCAIIRQFCLSDGVFSDIGALFGFERTSILQNPDNFRSVYVISGIWQEVGWGSIIYLAALTGIDPQLYEAAEIDGAGRFKQTIHITLPGILPTIMMLLILRMGSVLNVGYEKVLLLYNENIYETADVISTYVYRKGIIDADFGYSTAIGLFNSVINVIFLVGANRISKMTTDIGLF